MNLAALLLTYEFGAGVYGGLGRHVTALAHALAQHGVSVDVATLGRDDVRADGPAANQDGAGDVRVHRTPAVPRVGHGTDWLASLLAFDSMLPIAAAASLDRAQVVHAHDWLVARTAFALSGRCPLVVTVHATERGRHQGWLPDANSRFVDAAERWLATSATKVIVCSEAMRLAVLAQWGVDPARLSVIPNAVEADMLPRDPEPGRVLFAGRLEHEKGGQVLIGALARLHTAGTTVRAVFAGTGSQRRAWEQLAEQRGIGASVQFVGHLPWTELQLEYARAEVVAVPSLYEPFGMVAAEAMAAGAPLVATTVDGLAETVGLGGVLIDPDDEAALAAALQHLLTSAAARRRAEVAARRRAADLPSWQETAARTVAVYDAAIGDNSDRSR